MTQEQLQDFAIQVQRIKDNSTLGNIKQWFKELEQSIKSDEKINSNVAKHYCMGFSDCIEQLERIMKQTYVEIDSNNQIIESNQTIKVIEVSEVLCSAH